MKTRFSNWQEKVVFPLGRISEIIRGPAASNFLWLVLDRGLRLLVGLFVGSWCARYLGKHDFGLLNYAVSLVAIFTSVASLGMDGIVVREIVRSEESAGKWIGSAMGFRAVTSVICVSAALLTIRGEASDSESQLLVMILLLGVGGIGQSMETGELLFQARNSMRHLVVPRLGVFFIINVLKVGVILSGGSVVHFALLTMCEQLAGGVLTLFMTRSHLKGPVKLDFIAMHGWRLLRESWPLALSGITVVLYMKSAQVILYKLLGDSALGLYSAAIRLPETANFIPVVLGSSMLPGLIRGRSAGPAVFTRLLLQYFRINALISLVLCGLMCVLAPVLMNFLYGEQYAAGSPVLAVHTWSLLFVFTGLARSQYLVVEGLLRESFYFTLLGLGTFLGAGWLLIPPFGVMGAAFATVVAYSVSAYLSSFLLPSTRLIGKIQTISFLTPWKVF